MKMIVSVLTLALVATCGFSQETRTAAQSQSKLSPVPVKSGVAVLTSANTRIDFVGTHEGPKPDPRLGGFAKFTGKAEVAENGAVESISLDIETASLWTEIPKLTEHLKSPDFFDVREHPKATFRSTAIRQAKKAGEFHITGDFTLLGTTRSIKIPATVAVTPAGITVLSKFTLDRTQFGMDYGQGKVKNDVALTVAIGRPTDRAGK